MVRPAWFEQATPSFGGWYSIQLSYGRVVPEARIQNTEYGSQKFGKERLREFSVTAQES